MYNSKPKSADKPEKIKKTFAFRPEVRHHRRRAEDVQQAKEKRAVGSASHPRSREDLGRFLKQAKEDGFYEFFLLELGTGMRRGEMLGLQWDDLNFRTGELHVCRQVCAVDGKLEISVPKTKSSVRTIVLPPSLVEVLKEYKKTVD